MVFSATFNNISAILWGLGRCGEEGGKLGREYEGGSGECGGEGRGGWEQYDVYNGQYLSIIQCYLFHLSKYVSFWKHPTTWTSEEIILVLSSVYFCITIR
jgi:hypothetical protein